MKKLDALQSECRAWLTAQRLPQLSADDILAEWRKGTRALSGPQVMWLRDFEWRWDIARYEPSTSTTSEVRAFNLPAAPPDCPCTLDVYTSENCRVWVTCGPPETEAEWKARRAAEGDDYFPRFAIQIEVKDREYYDCWEASEYWSDALQWVRQGQSFGFAEDAKRKKTA